MKTKKQTERLIWQNMDLSIDDYNDFLSEEYPEVTGENERIDLINELNQMYLDDERMNLNIELDNPIIVIADLGLWNGRKSGYKFIKSGNIKDTLYDNNCDYCKWYCDRYDYKFIGHHHDGTNCYIYREVKDMDKIDILTEKLYNGTATQADITRYTRSIRPYIAKVYGW